MLKVAQVLKSNGTDGELLMSFLEVGPEDIDTEEPVYIYFDGLPVPFYFESFNQRGTSRALVRLTGVHSLKDADELAGRDVFADYFEDEEEEELTGWKVLGEDGTPIGTITAYEDIPGNLCIYIGETLVPLHPDLIRSADPEKQILDLDLPDGLL